MPACTSTMIMIPKEENYSTIMGLSSTQQRTILAPIYTNFTCKYLLFLAFRENV